jgi:hypothetical protein
MAKAAKMTANADIAKGKVWPPVVIEVAPEEPVVALGVLPLEVDEAAEEAICVLPLAEATALSGHSGVAMTMLTTNALQVEASAEIVDSREVDHSPTLVTQA